MILPYSAPAAIMAAQMQHQQFSQPQLRNSQKTVIENKKSLLLSDEENATIFSMLGRKCFVSKNVNIPILILFINIYDLIFLVVVHCNCRIVAN